MFFVSLFVIGLIAALRLPLEAYPDISPPFVDVNIPYTGSTPEEVERTITRPAEEALATLSGIKEMDSTSGPDGSNIFMQFSDWSRDIAIAASEAHDRIDAIRDQLPTDLQRYLVQKFSSSDQAILQVRFASDRDLRTEYDLIDREFKRPIERLPGVARVEVSGAAPNEVEIAIDPDRLTAHGINLNDLSTRLKAVNFSVSAGEIDDGGKRLRVEPVGEVTDLDQLRTLVVGPNGLRLGDIADVHFKQQRVDVGRRLNGKQAVGINIYKERDANLVDVARGARWPEIDQIRARSPSCAACSINVIDNEAKASPTR